MKKDNKYFKRGIILCTLSLLSMLIYSILISYFSIQIAILVFLLVFSEGGFFVGLMYIWNRVSIEMRCKQAMENLFETTRKLKK